MLDLDEKGSNVLSVIHIVLIEVFFLFLGSVSNKKGKSQVLMQMKAIGMIFQEEKRSEEVLRARRARLKSPRKCTVVRELRHNRAETYRFQS